MLSPEQIRAARAILDWSTAELAQKSGLTPNGLNKIERGLVKPHQATLDKLQEILESHGIELIAGRGVARRDDFLTVMEGEGFYLRFMDFIYHTMIQTKDEVLFFCVDDRLSTPEVIEANERLHKAGIVCRYICEEGNPVHSFDSGCYREIPSKFFRNGVQIVFSDRVATTSKHGRVVIIRDAELAETQRALFNLIWSKYPAPRGRKK